MDEEGIKITRSKYTPYMDRKKDALQFDANKRQAAKDKTNDAHDSSGDEPSSEEEDGTDHEASSHNMLDNVSLLEWLRHYNFKTGAKRPRAKPRCIPATQRALRQLIMWSTVE
jgi:hypothetical protein